MRRVLITGLSGTGKSTLLATLAKRGFAAVDTDHDGFRGPADGSEPDGPHARPDWIWRPERIDALLSRTDVEVLFVSGCVENQGDFYNRFEHVVLLTAPREVLARRLATRTTNDYGRDPAQRAEALGYLDTVEPLLRRGATLVVDSSAAPDEVADAVVAHVGAR